MTTTVNHVALALARLPQQWQDKPNIIAFVTLFVEQVQDLEDALWALRVDRAIASADGVQLDAIGVVVGEARTGQTDDVYRQFLRARIATNRSSGLTEDMIKIARLLIDDLSVRVIVRNDGNAAITIRLFGAVAADTADALIAFLRTAAGAGVRVTLISSTAASTRTFRFAKSGFATSISAAASVINIGLDNHAHPEIPTTGGHLLLQGTQNTGAGIAREEVVAYQALNRATSPDRYDVVDPPTVYAYDLWPTAGAAEVRPLGSLPADGFGTSTVGAYSVPAGSFRLTDDIGGNETIDIPAGFYSPRILAGMIRYQMPAGFSVTISSGNELEITYGGAGAEWNLDTISSSAFQTALGLVVLAAELPGTYVFDPMTPGAAAGLWASARV